MIHNINIQKHEIKPTGKILDIASGHHPFVREGLDVTYIDKYPDKNVSRRSDLVQPGKEVMQMDVEDMSFEDGEFDYSVCFPIGTMISGCNKEIETIRVGDTVLGENGQHQKVINTFKRKFNGKLVYIKPLGIEATKVTPEHKILTTTFRRIHRQNNLKGKGNIYEWVRGGLIWKQAKDIKKRDYLLIPRNKKSEEYEFELRIGRLGRGYGLGCLEK